MRLTRAHKESFVRKVIRDLPSVDYDAQAKTIAIEALKKIVPPEILKLSESHPKWLRKGSYVLPGMLRNVEFYAYESEVMGYNMTVETECGNTWRELEEIAKLKNLQEQNRIKLAREVDALINACSSLTQAIKHLPPEFHKYLPARVESKTMLPAIINTAERLKQAGWPKPEGIENESK